MIYQHLRALLLLALFTHSQNLLACSLDIDGNGRQDALTDGILVMRYLFGFRGDALIDGTLATDASRVNADAIEAYLDNDACQQYFDIDGSGERDALSDGIIAVRYLFGFTEQALTQNALAANATRTSATAIKQWMNYRFSTRPTMPRLIEVSSFDATQISVSWMPAEDDVTPSDELVYTVHIADNAGFIPDASTAKTTLTGALHATISGLQADTLYYVKVTARDTDNLESWSRSLAVKTVAIAAQRSFASVQVQTAQQQPEVTEDHVSFRSEAQLPQAGEIISSVAGSGYLRKVINSTILADGRVEVLTEPASLNEVYDQFEFAVNVKIEPQPESSQTRQLKIRKNDQERYMQWASGGLTLIEQHSPHLRQAAAHHQAKYHAKGRAKVSVDGDRQTSTGTYVQVQAPAFITAAPGQQVLAKIEANIFNDHGRPLQICTINFLDWKHRDSALEDLAHPDIGQFLSANAEQSGSLTMSWVPSNAHVHDGGLPYKARFEVIVDERGDCDRLFSLAEETLTIEIPFYVTMGQAPAIEEASINVGTAFSVSNELVFDFKPEFQINALIENARLQSADLMIKSDVTFTQELQINAQAFATLDKTVPVIPARRFIKILPSTPPVLVSGEFKIDAQFTGNAEGAIDLKETLLIEFPDTQFGLQYRDHNWHVVQNIEPVTRFTLAGDANAAVKLEVRLIPDLQIHLYDAASGRILLEPYLYSEAGLHGQALYQQEGNATATDLDYWFTQLEFGGGIDLRLYAGLHIFDYNILSYPNDVELNDIDHFAVFHPIERTAIAKLPTLSSELDLGAIPSAALGDSRALLIHKSSVDVPNPLFDLFGVGDESLWPFAHWTDAAVVSLDTQAEVQTETLENGETEHWFIYTQAAQSYTIRVAGHSHLGPFVRQVTEIEYQIVDADNDGMADIWEQRWNLDDPNADKDGDGLTNLQEFQQGSFPSDGIVDVNLKACINEHLGLSVEAEATVAQLQAIVELDCREREIVSIEGLEQLTELQLLGLGGNQIADIGALAGLTGLQRLELWGNSISNISALAGLTGLQWLELGGEQIFDISALAGLTELQQLGLVGTQVSNISALAGLTGLQVLHLGENQISDISALAGLTGLQSLALEENQISNISALAGLTGLQWLDLGENQISNISALAGLTGLSDLDLRGNQISDISALAGLTGLQRLRLWGNSISNISALAGLTGLSDLDLGGNQISDISVLYGLTELQWLGLTGYEIYVFDISSLAGLRLTEIEMPDMSLWDYQIADIYPRNFQSRMDMLIPYNYILHLTFQNELRLPSFSSGQS